MRILFVASSKEREGRLARAFCDGVRSFGEDAYVLQKVGEITTQHLIGFDVVAMVGVKSKALWQAALEANAVPLMFDKGYVRTKGSHGVWDYWRVSAFDHHPTKFLSIDTQPSDRFDKLDLEIAPWGGGGSHVLIAGSSAKYHDFHDLPDPTKWARRVVRKLNRKTALPIIYRPKPSWRGAVEIKGTTYSGPKDKLLPVLTRAHAVVTHGSNISFEAALLGIPSIVLGNGVGAALGGTELSQIKRLPLGDRERWFYNLAYWQWTEEEMRSGEMWQFLRPRIALSS